MPVRHTPLVPGEFYHIYNRGNSRQIIYRTPDDYARFLALLYLANSTDSFVFRDIDSDILFDHEKEEPLVAIGAYCLMPNHFHLLVTPTVEGGISKFMGKVATGYSMYFNKKYDRSGTLFEGRFKAKHSDNDDYLKYLYAYIHLNPLKLSPKTLSEEEKIQQLYRYPYYSLYDYLHGTQVRPERSLLNPSYFPAYFQTAAEHKEELEDWLTFEY